MPLTQSQRQIISSTAPLLAEQGLTVTRHFYDNLLLHNPSLRSTFSVTSQLPPSSHQPAALAASLYAYANNIDDLTPILPVVEKINQKHASLNIKPEHYAVVGEGLLKSMGEILGPDVFTDEVREAWFVGYNQLAAIMSGREDAIHAEHEAKSGGWKGWRTMRIVKKVKESEDATSFYFLPVDGGDVPDFKPGQYVSVSIDVPGLGHKQIRQYSLSDAPPARKTSVKLNGYVNGHADTNGYTNGHTGTNGHHETKDTSETNGTPADLRKPYRITVKRESGLNGQHVSAISACPVHPGYVSNLLHDTQNEGDIVEMSHPAGEFFLDQNLALEDTAPVVLISAGVGLTPLTSMLAHLLSRPNAHDRPISWIHVARNAAVDPFAKDVAKVTQEHKLVRSRVFHTTPSADEREGVDYDVAGRPDLLAFDKTARQELLFLKDQGARYFMCGPNEFMSGCAKALTTMGVDAERVKMELFGVGSIGA